MSCAVLKLSLPAEVQCRRACRAQEGGRPAGRIGGPAEGDPGFHREAWPPHSDGDGGHVPGLNRRGCLQVHACNSACRDAEGCSHVCHFQRRLGPLGSEPARPAPSAGEVPPRVQLLQATSDDSIAVEEAVHHRFSAPELVKTIMSEREDEPPATSAPSAHHDQSHRHPFH